jgi:hypothetical protein
LTELTTAKKVKRHIDQAMEKPILIAEQIRNAVDIIDEQPSAVIEAMIERGKHLQLSGNAPKHRYGLRAAIIEYLEQRLREARDRERQLVQAITGARRTSSTTSAPAEGDAETSRRDLETEPSGATAFPRADAAAVGAIANGLRHSIMRAISDGFSLPLPSLLPASRWPIFSE